MTNVDSTQLTNAWVIRAPSVGEYKPGCLAIEERTLPPMRQGDLKLRTLFVSLDPTYLGWLRLKESYIVPLAVGDVMKGVVLAVVEESRAAGFETGDIVTAVADWATHSVISADSQQAVPPAKVTRIPGVPLSAHLTVFSHIGLAAIIGIAEVAKASPGDVVLVSGAAGAVGALVCEIARDYGCRVVGIAGGPEKCRFLTDELKLDGAIDYKRDNLDESLSRLCPAGIDVYFDNVGGPILDTVLMHLALRARIAVCGEISQYNLADPSKHYGIKNLFRLVLRSARMEGFVPPAYTHRYPDLFAELGRLYAQGAIKHRPHIVHGLEPIAEAMGLLVTGGNRGKLMAQVAPDPVPTG